MKKNNTEYAAIAAALVGSAVTAVGLFVLGKLQRRTEERKHGKPMTFAELYEDNAVASGEVWFDDLGGKGA